MPGRYVAAGFRVRHTSPHAHVRVLPSRTADLMCRTHTSSHVLYAVSSTVGRTFPCLHCDFGVCDPVGCPRSRQVDNVEDRQSRIKEEQKGGGAGTAYAIAVTHMLKKDPSTSNTASKADRKTVRIADPASSAEAPRGSDQLTVEQTKAEEGPAGGEEKGGGAEGAVNTNSFSSESDDDEGDMEDYSDSEYDSQSGDEEEGQRRRGWAERRARLRKDGMHGRRLPPPEAEEERASAKADKREVRCALLLFSSRHRDRRWQPADHNFTEVHCCSMFTCYTILPGTSYLSCEEGRLMSYPSTHAFFGAVQVSPLLVLLLAYPLQSQLRKSSRRR